MSPHLKRAQLARKSRKRRNVLRFLKSHAPAFGHAGFRRSTMPGCDLRMVVRVSCVRLDARGRLPEGWRPVTCPAVSLLALALHRHWPGLRKLMAA